MRVCAALFILSLGCSSQPSGPAITCSDIAFSNTGADCSFDEPTVCSDNHAYSVDCQDDSTCSCSVDGQQTKSFFASGATSGFCATVTTSSLHDLAAKCGWNINP